MGDMWSDGIIVAIAVGVSLWFRWAVIPVLIAFRAGRLYERTRTHEPEETARGGVGLRAR